MLRCSILSFFFPLGESPAFSQKIFNTQLSEEQWKKDIDSLVEAIELIHPNPYFRKNKNSFLEEVDALKDKLGNLTKDEIFIEIMKLVASLEDGHTHIPMHQEKINFTMLPLRLFLFDDGLYIIDSQNTPELIGSRLIKIGRKTVEELFYDIKALIPADNLNHTNNVFTFEVIKPEFLYTLKAINSTNEIPITVSIKGELKEIILSSVPSHNYFQWAFREESDSTLPLYQQNSRKDYWWLQLPDKKILYFKYNNVISSKEYPIGDLTRDLDSVIKTNNIEKLIIDLRDNPGGNNNTIGGLVKMIQSSSINSPGKLFILTGRRTNSAAITFLTKMDMQANAIVIGEAAGASPLFYSDIKKVKLQNSEIEVAISTQYQPHSFFQDNRRAPFPDISIPRLSNKFSNGLDPFLETAMKYTHLPVDEVPLNSTQKDQIKGRYKLENQVAVIKEKNDELYIEVDNLFYKKLFHKGNLSFTDFKNTLEIKFEPQEKKAIFSWHSVNSNMEKMGLEEFTALENIQRGEIDEAISQIRHILKTNLPYQVISEQSLNKYGYIYLKEGKIQDAIKLFSYNVELYPKSANVYDSLAEAYFKAGMEKQALLNYKKSLSINPNNLNAKKYINELEK